MAKKKSSLGNLAVLVPLAAAVLALVLAIFLPGVIAESDNGKATISLLAFIFGSATVKSSYTVGNTTINNESAYTGGMSTMGLIAVILLVLGIIALVAKMFISGKKLDLIGSLLIVVGGIFLFLCLSAGADVSVTEKVSITFKEAFESYKLGLGVYVCGIVSILGGGYGIYKRINK